MSNNTRVFNQSRGFSMKHSQALKAVANCACAWVVFGSSIRDLTLAESIARRNEQAKSREPLPFAEIPGLIFKPSPGRESSARDSYQAVREANQFAEFATR